MTTPTTTGREYLRVSVDHSGREKSQDEQHGDNLAAAPALGIDRFAEPYRDTGSASKHARRQRDDFARLLADLGAGRFAADVLVLWESSRGSRKVGEWVTLVEVCEQAGVRIAVTSHGRVYDPANPRDRRSLLEDAVDGEYEVAKTSARAKRSAASMAVAGQPHGLTPFGYRRTYDPTTRRLIAQEPDPDEAPVVIELFDRLAAGDSLSAIAKDFRARGIRSRRGKVLAPQAVRLLALNVAYVGKRVHSPSGSAEATYDATWPALVDPATFYAVQNRLLDPARTTTRPGRGKWLLSMIAVCDCCGSRLGAKFPGGVRRYVCHGPGGCASVDADELDAWAEHEVLAILTRPDVVERLMPTAADPVALEAARGEAAKVAAEHRDLVRRVGSGQLSAAMAAGAEPAILARLAVADAKVVDLTAPAGLRRLVEPGAQVEARWAQMAMPAKREVMRLLFAPGVMGVLSIAQGRGTSTQDRIRLDGKPLA